MAEWEQNPNWVNIENINGGMEIQLGDGFLASDQNKIIENMQYLYNHFSSQHVYVGNVSTVTGAAGTQAIVSVTSRPATDGIYLDFAFTIPKGDQGIQGNTGSFGTPTATANTTAPGAPATVSVSASGPDTAKIFAFSFGLPRGNTGPVGPPGPSVSAGMSPITINIDDWSGSIGNYTISIPATKHGLGATPNLIVTTLPNAASLDTYEETYDSPIIQSDGTVIISSNIQWAGIVLIAGGIAEAVDAEARVSIDTINSKIPTQAAPDNQLADKDFVNSSIASMAAKFVTPTASATETQWATFEALQAGPWFYNGTTYTPSQNDYAIYLNTDNSVWRAHYTGTEWQAQYEVNDTPFTAEQLASLNSGATIANITAANNHVASRANPHQVTPAQIGAATTQQLSAHTNDTANPHSVTKEQVGLSNLTNEAQLPLTGGTVTGPVIIKEFIKLDRTDDLGGAPRDPMIIINHIGPTWCAIGGSPVPEQIKFAATNSGALDAVWIDSENITWDFRGKITENDQRVYSPNNPPPAVESNPYVELVSSWSGSAGNYTKIITAATHGKGLYPSVHTYIQNGSLWEETYDSPATAANGDVTLYTNVSIPIRVVIK